MKKEKLIYGNELIICPICKSKTFDYVSYSESGFGTVEQHGLCKRCGFCVEQVYSPVMTCFFDRKKGFKNHSGKYIPKNVKKHRRIRKKLGIKGYEINPTWVYYT